MEGSRGGADDGGWGCSPEDSEKQQKQQKVGE